MTPEEFRARLTYHVDDDGILTIYYANVSICEISECDDMATDELEELVDEAATESSLYQVLVDDPDDLDESSN